MEGALLGSCEGRLGTVDGASLDCVGRPVGAVDGVSLGAGVVKRPVGAEEAVSVGFCIGRSVGTADWVSLGVGVTARPVGAVDQVSVGFWVGRPDGTAVGVSLGLDVGSPDGIALMASGMTISTVVASSLAGRMSSAEQSGPGSNTPNEIKGRKTQKMKSEIKRGNSCDCAWTLGMIVASRPTTNSNGVGTFILETEESSASICAYEKEEEE